MTQRIYGLILWVTCLPGLNVAAQTPDTAMPAPPHTVGKVKITILSTMLSDSYEGEWGFSALVEVDSFRILFDAGAHESTVIDNAKKMKIDLSGIPDIILSHSHPDHTGGWKHLREQFAGKGSFSVTHVGDGFFYPRMDSAGKQYYDRKKDSAWYIGTGGQYAVCRSFTELYPGVYLTGPVPRKYPEKNYGKGVWLQTENGPKADDLPEDMSLVIVTDKGLILLSGCGHAGIINTIDYTRSKLDQRKLVAAIGGFHLYEADDERVAWTAGQLKQAGIEYFIGAHCTGINSVYEIRQLCGLARSQCVVGAVGASFDLVKGISPGELAQ